MRIAIVEDDPLLLKNLELLLGSEPGINVVGAYSSGEDALRSLKNASPEIMLTDLGLPGMSGIELIKKAKDDMSRLEIMVHTVFEDTESMLSAVKAGASGYLLKGAAPWEIIEALRSLKSGGAAMSSTMAQKVISEFEGEAERGYDPLSRTERIVVNYLAEGMTCEQISKKSGSNNDAVRACIKNIYEMLRERGGRSPYNEA